MKTKSGIVISDESILEAAERDDCTGFCLQCGFEQGGCEPDMRKGECEQCGTPAVFGTEELLLKIAF